MWRMGKAAASTVSSAAAPSRDGGERSFESFVLGGGAPFGGSEGKRGCNTRCTMAGPRYSLCMPAWNVWKRGRAAPMCDLGRARFANLSLRY